MANEVVDPHNEKITRTELGQFVKGVSGNPAGRPKGVKNRTTLVRNAIAESLLNDLAEEAHMLLDTAIALAKDGDQQMLKLLLKDFIIAPTDGEDEDGADSGKIQITISNLTVNQSETSDATPLEGVFTKEQD